MSAIQSESAILVLTFGGVDCGPASHKSILGGWRKRFAFVAAILKCHGSISPTACFLDLPIDANKPADGIWIIDAEGKTVFANEPMTEILGTAPAAIIGEDSFHYVMCSRKTSTLPSGS